MAPSERIDAHHHAWDLGVRPQPWIDRSMSAIRRDFSIEDLQAVAQPAGITGSVLVQTVHDVAETEELLGIAAASAWVLAVVGWVDLTAESVGTELARLAALPGGGKLRGIRHLVQAEPDPGWLRRDDVARGLQALGAAGLAYDLLTLPHQLPAAIDAVRRAPATTFVLDHCSKPLIAAGETEPWARDLRALAALPNVSCKLSGLVTEANWRTWTPATLRPYADLVLSAFGPDRVMFGSDWPVCLLATSYAGWVGAVEELTSELSSDERESVWHGAARRAYRVDRE